MLRKLDDFLNMIYQYTTSTCPYSFAFDISFVSSIFFFLYYNTPVLQLKSAFPRKDVPSAPPKHAFLRINSSRLLLEEVKCILKLNVLC